MRRCPAALPTPPFNWRGAKAMSSCIQPPCCQCHMPRAPLPCFHPHAASATRPARRCHAFNPLLPVSHAPRAAALPCMHASTCNAHSSCCSRARAGSVTTAAPRPWLPAGSGRSLQASAHPAAAVSPPRSPVQGWLQGCKVATYSGSGMGSAGQLPQQYRVTGRQLRKLQVHLQRRQRGAWPPRNPQQARTCAEMAPWAEGARPASPTAAQ